MAAGSWKLRNFRATDVNGILHLSQCYYAGSNESGSTPPYAAHPSAAMRERREDRVHIQKRDLCFVFILVVHATPTTFLQPRVGARFDGQSDLRTGIGRTLRRSSVPRLFHSKRYISLLRRFRDVMNPSIPLSLRACLDGRF
jgi:hypothetical protein